MKARLCRTAAVIIVLCLIISGLPPEAFAATSSGQLEVLGGKEYKGYHWEYLYYKNSKNAGGAGAKRIPMYYAGNKGAGSLDPNTDYYHKTNVLEKSIRTSGSSTTNKTSVPIYRLSRAAGYSSDNTSAYYISAISVTEPTALKTNGNKLIGSKSQKLTDKSASMIVSVLQNGFVQHSNADGIGRSINDQMYYLATQILIWEIGEGKRTGWNKKSGYAPSAPFGKLRYWQDYWYSIYNNRGEQNFPDYYSQILTACERAASAPAVTGKKMYSSKSSTYKLGLNMQSSPAFDMPVNGDSNALTLSLSSVFGASDTLGGFNYNRIVLPITSPESPTGRFFARDGVFSYILPSTASKSVYKFNKANNIKILGKTLDGKWYYVWHSGTKPNYSYVKASDIAAKSSWRWDLKASLSSGKIKFEYNGPSRNEEKAFTVYISRFVRTIFNETGLLEGTSAAKYQGYLLGANTPCETFSLRLYASTVSRENVYNLRAKTAVSPSCTTVGESVLASATFCNTGNAALSGKYSLYFNGEPISEYHEVPVNLSAGEEFTLNDIELSQNSPGDAEFRAVITPSNLPDGCAETDTGDNDHSTALSFYEPELYDFSVDISPKEKTVPAGTEIEYNISITNVGLADITPQTAAKTPLTYTVDGESFTVPIAENAEPEKGEIENFNAGDTYEVTKRTVKDTPGSEEIEVVVNTNGAFKEENRENNTAAATFKWTDDLPDLAVDISLPEKDAEPGEILDASATVTATAGETGTVLSNFPIKATLGGDEVDLSHCSFSLDGVSVSYSDLFDEEGLVRTGNGYFTDSSTLLIENLCISAQNEGKISLNICVNPDGTAFSESNYNNNRASVTASFASEQDYSVQIVTEKSDIYLSQNNSLFALVVFKRKVLDNFSPVSYIEMGENGFFTKYMPIGRSSGRHVAFGNSTSDILTYTEIDDMLSSAGIKAKADDSTVYTYKNGANLSFAEGEKYLIVPVLLSMNSSKSAFGSGLVPSYSQLKLYANINTIAPDKKYSSSFTGGDYSDKGYSYAEENDKENNEILSTVGLSPSVVRVVMQDADGNSLNPKLFEDIAITDFTGNKLDFDFNNYSDGEKSYSQYLVTARDSYVQLKLSAKYANHISVETHKSDFSLVNSISPEEILHPGSWYAVNEDEGVRKCFSLSLRPNTKYIFSLNAAEGAVKALSGEISVGENATGDNKTFALGKKTTVFSTDDTGNAFIFADLDDALSEGEIADRLSGVFDGASLYQFTSNDEDTLTTEKNPLVNLDESTQLYTVNTKVAAAVTDIVITVDNKINNKPLQDDLIVKTEGEKISLKELSDFIMEAERRENQNYFTSLILKNLTYGKTKSGYTPSDTVIPEPDKLDSSYLNTYYGCLADGESVCIEVTYSGVNEIGGSATKAAKITVNYNKPPKVIASDYWTTLEDFSAEKWTEKDFLSLAAASDEEDGEKITDSLKLISPFSSQSVTKSGTYELLYLVTDSGGKEGLCSAKLHIIEGFAVSQTVKPYTRFISESYYTKQNKDLGALESWSRWYLEPEYSALIENCFKNSKSEDNSWASSIQEWKFSNNDIKRVKSFIGTYRSDGSSTGDGIGNHLNEGALSDFIHEFSANRVK